MLENNIYPWIVATFKPLGLNFAFLLEAYERDAFINGLWVTLQLCLCVIPGSLVAGVLLAAALTSEHRWLAGPTRPEQVARAQLRRQTFTYQGTA